MPTPAEDRGDSFTPSPEDVADPKKGAPAPGEEVKDPFALEDTPKEDEEKAAEGKKGGKKGVIPLDRHEALLNREREQRQALEQRLQQYQGGEKVAQFNDDIAKREDALTKLEDQYNKSLGAGDIEKATGLMKQIRLAEREINDLKSEARIQVATVQATETARYNATLERIEEAYPQLNQDSDDFDKELAQDVADMATMYRDRGMTPAAALQAAVKRLIKPETNKQTTATEVKARVNPEDVAAERQRLAAGKAADANKRQPPSLKDAGMNSDKAGGGPLDVKTVMTMSQADFAKLSQDDLAKMRGDTL